MALAIVAPHSWHRPWWPSPWWHHTHSISGPCPRGTTLVSPPLMALALVGTTLMASPMVALALVAPHSWHQWPLPSRHHTRGSALVVMGASPSPHSWLRPSAPLLVLALVAPHLGVRCCPQQCRRGQCSHVSLVDAVIGCRRCMPRSRACRRRSTRRGVPLAALAAVVSMMSLSSAVDVTQPTRVRTAAWCGLLLTALAAVVGYTVVGCRVGLAIALISCCRCSHRWRA